MAEAAVAGHEYDGRFADTVAACMASATLSAPSAAICTAAACRVNDGVHPQRWLARVAPQQRLALAARERADAVAARLGTLVLEIAEPVPTGLAITVNGRSVAVQHEVRDRVDPGDLTVVASAPAMPEFSSTVRVAAGQT